MRNDKAKNISKVIKSRAKNPLQTVREVAKDTGLDFSTVAKLDKEIPQITTKSQIIIDICQRDIDIVELGQKEIQRRFQNPEEIKDIRAVEISQIIRENTARYSIFKGDITDPDGGLKQQDFSLLTQEELELKRKELLS